MPFIYTYQIIAQSKTVKCPRFQKWATKNLPDSATKESLLAQLKDKIEGGKEGVLIALIEARLEAGSAREVSAYVTAVREQAEVWAARFAALLESDGLPGANQALARLALKELEALIISIEAQFSALLDPDEPVSRLWLQKVSCQYSLRVEALHSRMDEADPYGRRLKTVLGRVFSHLLTNQGDRRVTHRQLSWLVGFLDIAELRAQAFAGPLSPKLVFECLLLSDLNETDFKAFVRRETLRRAATKTSLVERLAFLEAFEVWVASIEPAAPVAFDGAQERLQPYLEKLLQRLILKTREALTTQQSVAQSLEAVGLKKIRLKRPVEEIRAVFDLLYERDFFDCARTELGEALAQILLTTGTGKAVPLGRTSARQRASAEVKEQVEALLEAKDLQGKKRRMA